MRAVAVGAVLLRVADGDNAALRLEPTTTDAAAEACFHFREGKGGRRGLLVR